jgi:hypothetical protein
MSEMVERVAQIIAVASWDTCGPRALSGCLPQTCACREQARAAIAAMREPTQHMKSAAVIDAEGEWRFGAHEARKCWQAMIDAALTESVSADSARQSAAGSASLEPQ